MAKDPIFELCDIVRETGFAIHQYLGQGHLEKIYENALINRLSKKGLRVEVQIPLPVFVEDGTLLGDLHPDLLIEGKLLIEAKAAKADSDAFAAQLLGYLRASRLEHGLLINFGMPKFFIKKYVLSPVVPGPQDLPPFAG